MTRHARTVVLYIAISAGLIGVLAAIAPGSIEFVTVSHSSEFHFKTQRQWDWLTGQTDTFSPFPGISYSKYWFGSVRDLRVAYWVLLVPPWAIAACIGCASIFYRRRRQNRLARGQCVKCGYDLTATPDRCPECGAFVQKD